MIKPIDIILKELDNIHFENGRIEILKKYGDSIVDRCNNMCTIGDNSALEMVITGAINSVKQEIG